MNGSPAGIGAVNGKKRAVEISQMLDGYIPAVEERKARKLLRRVLPDGRAGRKRPARRKGNKQRNSKSSASCPNENPGLPCRGRPGFFSRVLPGRHAGSADQWVPFAGASIFSSRISSMQMRCSWMIGSFATAPIEMLRTACSSVGQFIWKVTA